ncbi:MAG: hypothetical protein M3424_05010 [Actinomycetota bacterium]|nr:hypothetical protein [Actinomycetota bacterium]
MSAGRGLTWRAGDVVVRPHGDLEEANWKSHVLAGVEHDHDFRTARPVPTALGDWICDGWEAWRWLPGDADETRVADVICAGTAFHEAIASLERPAFIKRSNDPWSRADRMAWEEDVLPHDPLLDRLAREFRPVHSPSQVIHGDLLGNVLFAAGAPPTIIDWAPYWRPAGLGAAIAAVDAACWHAWPASRLAELGGAIPEWRQLLVRALTFRMVTLHNLQRWDAELDERHGPVVAAVVAIGT